jgi:hypothetical protein
MTTPDENMEPKTNQTIRSRSDACLKTKPIILIAGQNKMLIRASLDAMNKILSERSLDGPSQGDYQFIMFTNL